MKKKQWTVSTFWVVASIFLVALNMRPAVTSIGPLFNVLMDALQVSNTKMSLLTSIPVFCMGLFAPLAVPMQQKLGTKRAVGILMVLLMLANGLRIFKESYLLLSVTSFVAGFAIAMLGPMLNAYIKVKFPRRFSTVVGLYSFGIGTGATLSAALSVSIYNAVNQNVDIALGSWGLLAVVALGVWQLAIKEEAVRAGSKSVAVTSVEVRNPWKNSRAWMILIYFGLQTSLFFSIMSWLSPMLQSRGFSLTLASSMLTFMSIVQMVGNIVIPILMEKWPSRMHWILALSIWGMGGFVLLWMGSGFMLWLAVLMIGVVLSGLFPIGLVLPLDEANNEEEASSWSSMVLSGGFMMSAILPLIIGYCYDLTGNHIATYVIFLALMLSIMATAFMLKKI